jgi:hypothetical protein
MSEHVVRKQTEVPSPSALVEVGTILLGGLLGAVGGLLAGGIMYGSLVIGLFGAMGGAVVGMIGAVRSLEAALPPDADSE